MERLGGAAARKGLEYGSRYGDTVIARASLGSNAYSKTRDYQDDGKLNYSHLQ